MDIGEHIAHPIYGIVEIVQFVKELSSTNRKYVKIRFHNTNYSDIIRYDHFLKGICEDRKFIDYSNKIFITCCGPSKIIRFLGYRDKSKKSVVEIEFLNTKFITTAYLNDLESGKIIDIHLENFITQIQSSHIDCGIDTSKLYASNNSGPFKILAIDSAKEKRCFIQFILTGYIKNVLLRRALFGVVKDDSQFDRIPVDISLISDYESWLRFKIRSIWIGLIRRCTDTSSISYNQYGDKGITIDKKWMDFNTFCSDIKSLFQFDKFYNNPTFYQLDKDYLQLNIKKELRIYSKNTCVFLHYLDNSNIRALEYRNNNFNTLSSKYFGVKTVNGTTFTSDIRIDNRSFHLGSYCNEIAAASVYNYWHRRYHLFDIFPLFNDIQEMPPDEFIKYNNRVKYLYYLIKTD